jgi:hypothetical protein
MSALRTVIKDQAALLTFRTFKPRIAEFGYWYLAFGLATAWLAGIGRYWDNPRAYLWQHLGLGSVIYCIVLAAAVFLLLAPLKPRNWTYQNTLIFISLTALPALLYAFPIERFTDLESAQQINAWFLGVVAAWRVALLFRYLNQSAGLSGVQLTVAALLPIIVIINALSFLNLEHVVFRLMSGLREDELSPHDEAYGIVVLITAVSWVLLPFLLCGYGWFVYKARHRAA